MDSKIRNSLEVAVKKLEAYESWKEKMDWCKEKFGPEDLDTTWYWDAVESKFVFADPNNELIFKLVWG